MTDPPAWNRRALAAFRTRNYLYAVDLFRQALRADPADPLAKKGLERAQRRLAEDPRGTSCPPFPLGCTLAILSRLFKSPGGKG